MVSARQLASLPQTITHHAAVFDSEYARIMVLGGLQEVGGDPTRHVWTYSVVDDDWYNSAPNLPSARAECAAVIAEGMLYVWGSEMVCFWGYPLKLQLYRFKAVVSCCRHKLTSKC